MRRLETQWLILTFPQRKKLWTKQQKQQRMQGTQLQQIHRIYGCLSYLNHYSLANPKIISWVMQELIRHTLDRNQAHKLIWQLHKHTKWYQLTNKSNQDLANLSKQYMTANIGNIRVSTPLSHIHTEDQNECQESTVSQHTSSTTQRGDCATLPVNNNPIDNSHLTRPKPWCRGYFWQAEPCV